MHRRGSIRAMLLVGVVSLCSERAVARLPDEAPSLPAPSPSEFTIVNVSSAQELADACWNLQSNQAIVIAPGTYNLASVTFPNGVDGRLTIGRFGATPISNVQIRGSTNNPQDVVILGAGMLDTSVPYGFQMFTSSDVLIANLSVGNVYYHAIMLAANQGATRAHIYNVRAFDAGQQIIKGTQFTEDTIIEYSELFFTAGAVVHPEGSPPNTCYTNAIDALGASNWIIRDNFIHDIWCQNDALAGPSVLMWRESSGTVVERNLFLNNSRGVYFGFNPTDHTGGVVRNNYFVAQVGASYQQDVAIHTTSPNSVIAHNTILSRGTYVPGSDAVAIEVRWPETTNTTVVNNLADGIVSLRNSPPASPSNNNDVLNETWFENPTTGDLRLDGSDQSAMNQADSLATVTDDFTGSSRPAGTGITDLGAHEFCNAACEGGTDGGPASDGGPQSDGAPQSDSGPTGGDATSPKSGCAGVPASWFVGALWLLRRRRRGKRH